MSSEALQGLIKGLEKANNTFGRDKRHGCVESLQSLHQYLLDLGTEPGIRMPLLALIGALVDCEKGVANPITSAKRRPGAQQKREELAADQGFAAAVLELFQNAGEDELQYLSALSRSVDMDGASLKEFRKLIRKQLAPAASMAMYWSVITEAAGSGYAPLEQAMMGFRYLKAKAKKG
jgi:hypothetical protein